MSTLKSIDWVSMTVASPATLCFVLIFFQSAEDNFIIHATFHFPIQTNGIFALFTSVCFELKKHQKSHCVTGSHCTVSQVKSLFYKIAFKTISERLINRKNRSIGCVEERKNSRVEPVRHLDSNKSLDGMRSTCKKWPPKTGNL